MRDPERIDPIIERLREAWKANPDWRLGQLISNTAFPEDVFQIEDRNLAKGVEMCIPKQDDSVIHSLKDACDLCGND